MRQIMSIALLATTFFAGSSGAFAQAAVVQPDEPYYYEEYEAAPPVYKYRDDGPVLVRPIRPANCGEYRYWNGERCVDARVVPPDVR
jgi:hypothetical protein